MFVVFVCIIMPLYIFWCKALDRSHSFEKIFPIKPVLANLLWKGYRQQILIKSKVTFKSMFNVNVQMFKCSESIKKAKNFLPFSRYDLLL